MTIEKDNVLLAFGLNIAAGLATCLGGLLIFIPQFAPLANRTSLGVALGMSAGVMIFISLVEIFDESRKNFARGLSGSAKDDDCDDRCQGHAWLFTSLCFFVGALLVYLVDLLIHWISPGAEAEPEVVVEELTSLQTPSAIRTELGRITSPQFDGHTKEKLKRTGILTAIAIALHNFPEGIATYLGTLKDPRLGFALAIGIALHNIPEGIAVATPVYYATESRVQAFIWTFMSALFEPLGGLICFLLIPKGVGHYFEGVVFGLITGVMVTISFKELLPTAHRYCPKGERVTMAVFAGMAIMIVSLVLFAYAGV